MQIEEKNIQIENEKIYTNWKKYIKIEEEKNTNWRKNIQIPEIEKKIQIEFFFFLNIQIILVTYAKIVIWKVHEVII